MEVSNGRTYLFESLPVLISILRSKLSFYFLLAMLDVFPIGKTVVLLFKKKWAVRESQISLF
jgi:hypothetical protein